MRPRINRSVGVLALIATLAASPASATGQSLLQTPGEVIAADGQAVPGVPGAVFGGSGNFDLPVIDENGFVLFRARLTAGGVTALNDRAIFYGQTAAALALVVRGGDPAPGLPGVTLNAATLQGLGASPRLSADGNILFSSSVSGLGVTTTTDTAIFGGPASGGGLLVREGDVAPGTGGATLGSNLNSLAFQPTGLNRGFRCLFESALLGPGVTTANNAAWFTGLPGALELVQRKGDIVLGGQVISALGYVSQMNDAGQVLHDETLSTTLGTPPATAADNVTLWIYTPGVGNALVAREGDPAPGTAGATFNLASNAWFISTGADVFSRLGHTAFIADLLGGDVVAGVNDRGIYVGGPGSLALRVRKGDAAAGTPGVFVGINNASLTLNNQDAIAFQSSIAGATVTTADDTGIWVVSSTGATLVAREGDRAPGTAGAVLGSLSGLQMLFNDRGQVLFRADLIGGDVLPTGVNMSALYAWDPVVGLSLVLRGNDALPVAPGVTRTVSSFGGVQFNNGDAAPLGLNHRGDFALRVTMTDGTGAILRGHIGSLDGVARGVSAVLGGVHTLHLNAGAANAGRYYLVGGSASGTSPGFPVGALMIPLNPDSYLQFTLESPNTFPLGNTLGTLDPAGQATATVTVPSGLLASLAGLSLHHAYGVVSPLGVLTFASEAARLDLLP